MRPYAVTCCAALLAAATLHAQSFTTKPCNDTSHDGGVFNNWFGGSEHACELRSITLPFSNGRLDVRALNGSIDVIGEDRQDIALEAQVTAQSGSHEDAESILHRVTITTAGTIEAKGPKVANGHVWSVSYRLHVPHRLAAELHTTNGSVSLTALDGDIHAETVNGSLKLAELAGNVHAATTNGSIRATLIGSTWQGSGLSATTTNGAISVSVPQPYSAHLVANTVNGGTSLNAPGANQSRVTRKEIDTTFGSGGPTLTFETVNGGVSVQ